MPGKHFYLVYNILTETYEVWPLWDYISMVICGMEHNKPHYQSISLFESEAEANDARVKLMQK